MLWQTGEDCGPKVKKSSRLWQRKVTLGTLRHRDVDTFGYVTIKESLFQEHNVRGGKIKLRFVASDATGFLSSLILASFRETQELLCISHAMGFITDAEFLLLYEEIKSDNLDFPSQEYLTFYLPDKNGAKCTANLRVEKHHITRLEDALQIPAVFKCDQGTVCDGTEGLCILLKRFAYPCRYSDMMIPMFGRPVAEICMINNTVMDWVYDNHRHRIMDWNQTVLSAIQLESYADVIFNKGAPLTNYFGFVDRTVCPISRPGESQRLVYNGHKRVHGLKFQSVVVPNG